MNFYSINFCKIKYEEKITYVHIYHVSILDPLIIYTLNY